MTSPSGLPALERILIPWLSRSGLDRVGRRVNRSRVVIAMYHGFTATDAHDGIENHEHKHLHGRAFEAQLAFLLEHYRVISLGELVRALGTGAPLPERAAVLTIDDGYRSIYTVAYPALVKFQMPAAVFLATEFVDERRFLWTDRVEYLVNRTTRPTIAATVGGARVELPFATLESRMAADRRLRSMLKALRQEDRDDWVSALEDAAGCRVADAATVCDLYEPLPWREAAEMAASGLVTFGSHTHTHVILSRCDPARAAAELTTSRRIIENRLGRPCDLFCYPNGRRGDFNDTTRELLKAQGFSGALTTVYGKNRPDADPYTLRRYNLGKRLLPGEMRVRLSGLLG